MLSKTLRVLDLPEPITDIHYHSGDFTDFVKCPMVLLLTSLITLSDTSSLTSLLVITITSRDCQVLYSKCMIFCICSDNLICRIKLVTTALRILKSLLHSFSDVSRVLNQCS